ncbi:helix-hairpin-helix domain-containing protein [Corynebacterium macclintockiae]|uniref:helix-hairpin-helix domain-containing protein n=1 Tax=Corynebacterium macclintockiae TaxID=2913501 RepID=UPI003EB6B626
MSTRRMRLSSVDKVRARAEALAQPMPEHELANVDLDTHADMGGRASRALVVAVVVAALIGFALFACQRSDSEGGEAAPASGPELLAGTNAPGNNGVATNSAGGATDSAGGAGDAGAAGGATENSEEGDGDQECVVSVQGMVRHPGLLRVQANTRVGEAIEAAGGTLPKAVVLGINLAEQVSDGMQIVVDDKGSSVVYAGAGQTSAGGAAAPGDPNKAGGNPGAKSGANSGSKAGASAEGKINLNTADSAQLETISGIGPATAEAIIAWRDSNGPFTSVEQLLEVRGIGPAKFESMRDAVTI